MSEAHMAPVEPIERAILALPGHKVILDEYLPELYEVGVRAPNQAVKRNIERFPPDFMFQLTPEETQVPRSQTVTMKQGRRQHRKYRPYAFTEQDVAMLSSVLRSPRAATGRERWLTSSGQKTPAHWLA